MSPAPSINIASTLLADFERLRGASRRDPDVALEVRQDRLRRLLALLNNNASAFEDAISTDFGHRSKHETRLAEAMVVESSIKHALRHLKAWMMPRRVRTELPFLLGKNRLLPQPLGVVGVISPWNYPLQLTLAPVTPALAAGNVVLLKPSELVPSFAALLADLVPRYFKETEMTVSLGGADIASAFSSLPFDHLIFTGSTQVGRIVAEAAARNLTPVTLELGGKSPAIIDASANIAVAADRIAYGKLLNAGQTCVAPDYVLCAFDRVDAFVVDFKASVLRQFGNDPSNPDYTSIASDRHFDRLAGLLDDALAKGAQVVQTVTDPASWKSLRKFPPCLILNTSREMLVRKEEIFGPILPVIAVPDGPAAIDYVNSHDRPLALYWFGTDSAARDRVLTKTVSGGVTINDCLMHLAQENQPFGGVGASGMGAYHGEWGFRTLSKEKPIYYRSNLSGLELSRPPYGRRFDILLRALRRLT